MDNAEQLSPSPFDKAREREETDMENLFKEMDSGLTNKDLLKALYAYIDLCHAINNEACDDCKAKLKQKKG